MEDHKRDLITVLSAAILVVSGFSLGIGFSQLNAPPAEFQAQGFSQLSPQSDLTVKPATEFPININTASAGELEALSGIGPVLAERIVDYRKANGPFETVSGIQAVSGIGPATYEKLKDQITVK